MQNYKKNIILQFLNDIKLLWLKKKKKQIPIILAKIN